MIGRQRATERLKSVGMMRRESCLDCHEWAPMRKPRKDRPWLLSAAYAATFKFAWTGSVLESVNLFHAFDTLGGMKSGALTWIAVLVLLLPVFYVLSVGPACWYFTSGYASRYGSAGVSDAIDAFYYPLDCVCEASPMISAPIDRYTSLWRTSPPRSEPSLPTSVR